MLCALGSVLSRARERNEETTGREAESTVAEKGVRAIAVSCHGELLPEQRHLFQQAPVLCLDAGVLLCQGT